MPAAKPTIVGGGDEQDKYSPTRGNVKLAKKVPVSPKAQAHREHRLLARARDCDRKLAARTKTAELTRFADLEEKGEFEWYGVPQDLYFPKDLAPWGWSPLTERIFAFDFPLSAEGMLLADLEKFANTREHYVSHTNHWMRLITGNDRFQMVCLGQVEDVTYGYVTYDGGITRRGWYAVFEKYEGGSFYLQPPAGESMSAKYMTSSADTACYPVVAPEKPQFVGDVNGVPIYSKPAGKIPADFAITREMAKLGAVHETDPRVRYVHPETKELLDWLEWTYAQRRHFKASGCDASNLKAWREMPVFVRERLDELSSSAEAESSVMDDPAGRELFRNDYDKWSEPEIQTVDGFPLNWVYMGSNDLFPGDVLNLLMANRPGQEEKGGAAADPRAWQDRCLV